MTLIDLDALPRVLCRDRRNRTEPPTSICLHVPVSSEWEGAAEAVARYLQNPPATAGIHFTVDNDSIVMCADPRSETVPHCYRPSSWSIGIEIAGTLQSAADWDDPFSRAALAQTARLVATLCALFDIPPVQIISLEVAGKARGIFDHFEATRACRMMGWPQDGHTDVGSEFPWTEFIAAVVAELNPVEEDEDVAIQYPVRPLADGRWVKVRPVDGGRRLVSVLSGWADDIPADAVTEFRGTWTLDVAKALGKSSLRGDVFHGQDKTDPRRILVSDADGDYALSVA